ncbi:MAG: efflux RND transporter periplasmic adaptor subunit [Chloroflexi bacterium]|nr:efflux RND transporter periplasmic adaptor subunit [Chloroflexota bacterium]
MVSISLPLRGAARAPAVGAWLLTTLLVASACVPSNLPLIGSDSPSSSSSTDTASRNAETVHISRAIRGDIAGVQSYSAEVESKGNIAIVPHVTARLDNVAVSVGARVHQGDTLAELDRTDLQQQVQQAEAAQASAEAKLAQLKAGPRPEAQQAAQANADAANARLKALEAAQSSDDSSTLQKRVSDARAKLDQVSTPGQPDAQAVQQANTALDTAKQQLTQVLSDPNKSKDQNQVSAAQRALQQAQDAAIAAAKPPPLDQAAIQKAQGDLNDAEDAFSQQRMAPSQLDVDAAQAAVTVANAELQLVSAPATDDDLQAAQASVEQAFALAELARNRLNDATITAPVNGVVTDISAQVGATVGPSGAIITLIPPELVANVNADEVSASQLAVGQTAKLTVESYPQSTFQGVVKAIAPVLDPHTRTVAVEVEVGDPQGKLKPGMFSQMEIQTEVHQNALLVPREAILHAPPSEGTPAQTLVYVVVESRLRRQKVSIGAGDDKNVEILQGLNEGDNVVLNPGSDLIDGQLISAS